MIILISIILFFIVIYLITRKPIEKIEKDFSEICGDTTACAYDEDFRQARFENHTAIFNMSISKGEFCGGFEMIKDKLYITTFDNNDNTFRIIESDYYLDNQKTIYEKKTDVTIKARSYDKIIYFGEPGDRNKELKVEAYNLITNEYLGIVSQAKGLSYLGYAQELRNNALNLYKVEVVHLRLFNYNYVRVTNKETGEAKYVEDEHLLTNTAGQKIIEQKKYFWSNGYCTTNNKVYLICSIWSHEYKVFSNYLFNVVYEYDFETNSLKFKFHFTSKDYDGLYLYFGYE